MVSTRQSYVVGRAADFADRERRVVVLDGTEVGVYRVGDRFYAYENLCIHQGGPACEGMLVGKVTTHVNDDKGVDGEHYSDDELHIACPWHGYEYDITTGRFVGDPRFGLRRFEVEHRGDDLYVLT